MAIFNISHSENGKKLLSLKSPVDLSDIDTYECTSAGEISTIMSQAKIAQASWKKTTLKERVELMHRVADVVIQQQEKIMDVVMRETGKPQQEAMSMEVFSAVDSLLPHGMVLLFCLSTQSFRLFCVEIVLLLSLLRLLLCQELWLKKSLP